jgi:hypothetical protein
VRLVQAFTSPEVFTNKLRSVRARASRRPGLDGFCLIAIAHSDPISQAHALRVGFGWWRCPHAAGTAPSVRLRARQNHICQRDQGASPGDASVVEVLAAGGDSAGSKHSNVSSPTRKGSSRSARPENSLVG